MSTAIVDKVTSEANKHVGDVTSIIFHEGYLYSAGSDAKIKIWDSNLNFVKEMNIHAAHIYAIAIDSKGRLYSSSCDGTINFIEKPLESDQFAVILTHENEVETLFVDDKNVLYCGDDRGGVAAFENQRLKFTINIVEGVKSLYVEKELVYTLLNLDLSIHEVRDNGKFMMKASIHAKFPVTLFGKQSDGRSEFVAVLTRDGKGVKIVKNGLTEKFATLTVKENLHDMIVNAIKGCRKNNILFSCDYAGKLIKTQIITNELKEITSININSGCANCLDVIDDGDTQTVYVGSIDGTIKKVIFN